MFEKSLAGLIAQLNHHLAQDHGHVGEPVVGLADVVEAGLVQQNLLENEGGHGLTEL